MAPPPDLLDTLASLTASVTEAISSLPDPNADLQSVLPPKDGISLLDVKNDLLLSYLHHLVYLMLVRLRSQSLDGNPVVSELVKLRVLLDRGVKPLEAKLRYQIDKVVSAAKDADAEAQVTKQNSKKKADDSDSDLEEDSEADDEEDSDDAADKAPAKASDLAFRPNPKSLLASAPAADTRSRGESKDGIYKPPRIAATAMPEITGKKTAENRSRRSTALDDFVASELSGAPIPEPSIGSTIAASGRVVKTARDRKVEQERQEYEESNLVRLPKPSKKEQGRNKRNAARRDTLGGEDWSSFVGDVDKLTRTSGKKDVLSKSRKRSMEEGGGGGGRDIGAHFEGRKNLLKKRRKG